MSAAGGRMPYCWKCGAELKEEAKFCPNCGAPIGTTTESKRIERAPMISRIVKITGIAIAIIVVSIVVFSLAIRPRPEIVLVNGHDGFQGLNYVAFVDVGVRNNGGDGWVTVYAELRGSGYYGELNKRVYLASGETKNLQFVFDISFWNQGFSALSYKAWAVPS